MNKNRLKKLEEQLSVDESNWSISGLEYSGLPELNKYTLFKDKAYKNHINISAEYFQELQEKGISSKVVIITRG